MTDQQSHVRGQGSDAPAHRYTAALADEIERRWQDRWDASSAFVQPNPGEPGFDPSRPKYFCMDMFPYPSGAGLHVGHPEGYTATDIICRYKRMKGFNVLHPMGWDAFGLPAEQYAIQTGVHPAITTRRAIDTFRRQLKRFGFSYDWSREFATIDEDYYRWTQWIFLRLYNAWYDEERGRARPIEELEREFQEGRRPLRYNPRAAEYAHAPGVTERTVAGPWTNVDFETRRSIVDSYRLAYVSEQLVNWCPKLGTALANEEVIDGRSERGGYPVVRRPLRQWMMRITAYADRLLADLAGLDWPESTRTQQAEWIGRSEGAEIEFPLENPDGIPHQSLRVYTTRPDTIFGATYMVVAPEHPLVQAILEDPLPATDTQAVAAYVDRAKAKGDVARQADTKEKTGVFSGVYALNPATGQRIPVWIADYVLMGYGHGAIMAVPAHDERDFEFARAFGLPMPAVVRPSAAWLRANAPRSEENASDDDLLAIYEAAGALRFGVPYAGPGQAINSSNSEVSLDGLSTDDAKARIIAWLEAKGIGRRRVNYKLRDWLFSRQRYWGEPFPIVYDERGFHHPVAESALPVTLPPLEDFKPEESEDPQPLLAKAREWARTTAAEAGVRDLPSDAPVSRETNTMPGWAGSCWYYLRYCDAKNADRFISPEAERYWMGGGNPGGVDLYIGGSEHAVLHLLYARFWHKVLFDLGDVSTPEPFQKLFHQGLITSYAYQRADKGLVPSDMVYELRYADDGGGFASIHPVLGGEVERAIDAPSLPRALYEKLIKAGSLFVVFNDTANIGSHHLTESDVEEVAQITAKMSKSLKNVVNPDDVIADYGADTFRLYEMYMGPLEASKPWNTRDITGLFRFLQRAWRLAVDERTGQVRVGESPDMGVEKLLHRTIAKVGHDVEKLSFNTAIAAMIEFVNAATTAVGGDGGTGLSRSQLERFALMLSPFAPHMAEEVWSRLGHTTLCSLVPWPTVDESMLRDSEIELPVQVQGKVRARITVPADAADDAVTKIALADPKVAELLGGKPPKKVIVVKGRMVNVVV